MRLNALSACPGARTAPSFPISLLWGRRDRTTHSGRKVMVPLPAWSALLMATAAANVAPPRTIGNAVIAYVRNSTFEPLVVLEHNLSSDAAYGVMTHYWSTGEIVNWDTVVDYYVDGEETPSISLMEDMACGQGFPKAKYGTFNGAGAAWKGEMPPGVSGTFAAGEKMGKSGQVGGYYHYHKVLFQKSIKVTARSLTKGLQVVYMVVRGHEVAKDSPASVGLSLPSGFVVPPNARLQLQRIDNVTYQPLEFVPLVTLPKGYAGLLYLTTFAIQTIPAGNNYIEGCWHLFTRAESKWPGIVMGTGVEDYFDSAYWFCALGGQGACLFAHPTSGLLHFSRTAFNGSDVIDLGRPSGTNRSTWPLQGATVERLSAYRFFDQEVVGFSDGGALHWRNGDVGSKCGGCPPGTPNCAPTSEPVSPTAVRTYAWVYTWPLDPQAHGPAPNAPPIACPNASICGGGPDQQARLRNPANRHPTAGEGQEENRETPPLLRRGLLPESASLSEEGLGSRHWDW